MRDGLPAAKRLKQFERDNGLTASAAAMAIGVPLYTWCRWCGSTNVPLSTLGEWLDRGDQCADLASQIVGDWLDRHGYTLTRPD